VRTGRFWGMDTQEPTLLDAMSLHRYLYADGDPVNIIDPTGLYSQQFGYDVEDVVQAAYETEFGQSSLVTFGGWSRLGTANQKVHGKLLYRLMPDILDRRPRRGDKSKSPGRIWMEIKPLSLSGITRAAASWGLYYDAFSPFQIDPDTKWLADGRLFSVTSGGSTYPTLVFNCGGILFYTTSQQDYNLFSSIAQGALGFGVSVAVGAAAGKLVNVLTAIGAQGSEVQTINNVIQIGLRVESAQDALDTAVGF